MKKKWMCSLLLLTIFITSGLLIFATGINQSNANLIENINDPISGSSISVTHPPNIELEDGPTNHTISWTLTDEGSRDYFGAYSFTGDTVGSNPAGLSVFEGPTCTLNVIAEKDGHKNVLEGYDGGTISGEYWQLEDTYSNQPAGTIEYYIQTSGSSKYLRMYLYEDLNFAIYMYLDNGNLNYNDGSPHVICPISNDIFYHLKVDWNGPGWQVKVDETQYGSGYSYGFRIAPISGINRMHFSTASANGDYYHYLDAIDYSWAPGYYPNRNMDYTNGSTLNYAIFKNGTQETAWQPWSGQVQVDYNVSGQSLGVGAHNVSLVFNDKAGQWYH
ncbi:MAG: hypothetical protein HWN66_18775, partial [Candidatus Helarchaeota archaeon]|nr:hypothetical protein [Candidatus Helarchaeota archaeon]